MTDGGLRSVARAFTVLDAVTEAGGQAGITAIAARTGLAESTVHRIASTLVDLEVLRRLPDRRYALASRLVRLGGAATSVLGEQARPVLARLVEALGESANLATLSGDQAEYIAQVPSGHAMRLFTEVGRKVDLHCTGVGKAILSTFDRSRVAALVDRSGLPQRTPSSINDAGLLEAELAEAPERGYSLDEQEQELGVRCVAVPIRVSQSAVFAVSVSGPVVRMTDDLVDRAVPLLKEAAIEIARLLPVR